ncbi:signal recognition particle-docking protein FtsY [Thiomonas sp. FB-Cd]|uniref:signal recognition particle-docking protein FtsY n=1 Tax=Thiomonas sp. FB-Cd TaxID=1158292 RepID=UPI0004DED52D|nr:signal recognition particle-docking protein FtsY [Thiomonas sp. FB-Cd]
MFRFFKRKPVASPSAEPVLPELEGAMEPSIAASVGAETIPDRSTERLPQKSANAPSATAASGWFSRLRQGLRKSGAGISGLFGGSRVDESLYEELESALIQADAGMPATQYVLERLRKAVRAARAETPQQVKELLRDVLAELLAPLEKPLDIGLTAPTVIMMVGVNGAGKTTSIGKLTRYLQLAGCKVLLAAGDTFRAAAREQLAAWGERNAVQVIAQQGGDPAAVAFDAVTAGRARGMDVVIVDTAGRLPTQQHLMDELAKVKRVVGKAMEGAPHESILVIDATNGQNALAQLRAFDDTLKLTGIILTKLDGSAKGGVIAAIARERPVPIYFIGVGESLEDLQTFDARAFAQALVG